jgi:NAD+ kinase
MTAGFVVNPTREAAVQCAGDLARWLQSRGVRVRLQAAAAPVVGLPALGASDEAVGAAGFVVAASDGEIGAGDFVVALGGDGTVLAASRLAAPHDTPILGIHVGGPASFGFLTESTPAHATEALERVLAGQYRVDDRMMVAATVHRNGQHVATFSALNDLVIAKGALARLLKMKISVDETFIATYAADGIIVATPTGSTAYNLAAGGPLVHPTVRVIILTPICPHTLNVRSLIIGEEETARVVVVTDPRDKALLTVDGQVGFELRPGDVVEFARAACRARFIVLDGANFYHKLQTRLRLGERFGT